MTHNSRRLDCLSSRLNLGLLKSYFIWHILLVLLFIGSNFLIVLSEQQFNVFPFAIDKSQIWREQPLVQDFIMTYICLNLIKTTWVINKVYYFNIKQCIGNWLKLVPSTSMILFNVCPWHSLNTSTSISFCLIPDSFRSDKDRVTISYMAIIKQVSYRLDSNAVPATGKVRSEYQIVAQCIFL